MNKNLLTAGITVALGVLSMSAIASPTRITVTIDSLAPENGTLQTPHWVGFHDGQFDTYNGNTPANTLPAQGSRAIERLAEDGNTGPLTRLFDRISNGGVNATIAGPNGPLAAGESASMTFILDSDNPATRFFSYASMVLPSNDFWYSNGNPTAHQIFDENGNFVASTIIVGQDDILDAGTEINDEVPANTAFFGQSAPNTGVRERGTIQDFRGSNGQPQLSFQPPSNGGILADPQFSNADFTADGYQLVQIRFNAERLGPDAGQQAADFQPVRAQGQLRGSNEVPPVNTAASGRSAVTVTPRGVRFRNVFRRLSDVQMAHFHLGARGENGPVIANLIPAGTDLTSRRVQRRITRVLNGRLTASDLIGPLAGQPLSALADAIREGNVYVNIHTLANPAGELRAQLRARR